MSRRSPCSQDLYTFDPVDSPVAELDPHDGPGRSFIEGTIVQGHFERGGTPNVTNAVAEVLQVAHFRKLLEREPAQDAELIYLCFGRADRIHPLHGAWFSAAPGLGDLQHPAGGGYYSTLSSFAIRRLGGRPRHSGRHP